ncbi:MAG TPA: ATP-binding protein [Candidatus Moranbacteria bacterium]|nr:ATP-binding protein [Candidatus Moranbacteria bacterium]HSA08427.1 ATP-binding protein [Candidatus Moranbacteria bacterium]
MIYNFVTNAESCYVDIPNLLYYSHIPAAVIAFGIGLFVLLKNRDLAGKLLFLFSLTFSFWIFCNLILWISYNTQVIMFFWSLTYIIEAMIFIWSFYLSYVFVKQKDANIFLKIFLFILIVPFLIFMFQKSGIKEFNLVACEAVQGNLVYYSYGLEIFISVLLCGFFIKNIISSKDKIFRKKIIYFFIGIIFFIFAFSWSNIFANLIFDDFEIEQYGLFGMTFFMGVLAYIIVKYKAFNIKLIGAQALVIALIILVGSQFFFADNTTSRVLTGITMALSLGFGYVLIKSIQKEVERKEELQKMADSLAIANDKLRILDKAKTEFISIASHQLRTPVTAVKGFASLLLEGSYGEVSNSIKGALEKIYVSSERLVNLIEDLLNVSRIESGRLTFTFEMGSVNDILKELYDNFMLIAKSKKFYLDLKVPENPLPKIKMDAAKIRELISNFIDNAFKYTEKGGVTVKAEIRESGVVINEDGFVKEGEKSPYGKVIRVTVSDTGIGVPREEIPSLFKKFSRGKDVSRLHVGGTGLGLFVGKAIADAHHGATWVESDGEGKGSRFIIEIPIEAQV